MRRKSAVPGSPVNLGNQQSTRRPDSLVANNEGCNVGKVFVDDAAAQMGRKNLYMKGRGKSRKKGGRQSKNSRVDLTNDPGIIMRQNG